MKRRAYIDIETTGLSYYGCDLNVIGIGLERGRESCLLGVLTVELLVRHWSLLQALRLFLVMAVGGLFKVVRLRDCDLRCLSVCVLWGL
jgi:hypothetical protein